MSRKRRNSKRRQNRFQRRTGPGAAPGSVIVDPSAPAPRIHIITYGADTFEEHRDANLETVRSLIGKHRVLWVNVEGLGDAKTIEGLGELFKLHPLALEDVVHVHQRAKVDSYGEHLFIVARMVSLNDHLDTEQISMFLGSNFVLSFLEDPGDCLDPLRDRLRKKRGGTRVEGPDYLAYAIIDSVIDAYFPVLDDFDDRLSALDDETNSGSGFAILAPLHAIRTDLRLLRRSIGPHREMVNELLRDGHPLITQETRVHLRDCYDHTIQIIDVADIYREMCSDLRDFCISKMSARTNDVMKVLTIIATIFMPLSFFAGVWGMNFNTEASPYNMPELHWYYGYPAALGLMTLIAAGMMVYFWRKGWLRN